MAAFLRRVARVRFISFKDLGFSSDYSSNGINLSCRQCFARQVATDRISYISYNDNQKYRRDQASRSVLILQLKPSVELFDLCQKYGDVNKAFQIKRSDKFYLFVEFKDASSLIRLKSIVNQFPNLRRVPLESHFLYYRPASNRFDHKIPRVIACDLDENRLTDDDLLTCSTVGSQIMMLHRRLMMSEIDIRLRYFMCGEVERFLRRLFPSCVMKPFGSSVNGFGRYDCDVDMTLDLDCESGDQNLGNVRARSFYYLTKLKPESDRTFSQRSLEIIGGLIQFFMPQMINVRRVLRARIPIVKFTNVSVNIDCDLCLENRSAVQMSEVLFEACHSDERLAPLIFTVRHWARCSGITQSNPGPWLSNFMLTLLVVYCLQAHPQPILPPLKSLMCDDYRGSSVSSSMSKKKKHSNTNGNNTQSLEELLLHFYKFYSELDLSQGAISVIDGCMLPKPDQSPMFIYNPVESGLNVCKNVLDSHLQKFQSVCRTTYETLQSRSRMEVPGVVWGILTILKANAPTADRDSGLNSAHLTADEIHEEGPSEDTLKEELSNSVDVMLADSDIIGRKQNLKFNLSMQSILTDEEIK